MGKAMEKNTIFLIISMIFTSTIVTISSNAAPIYNPFNVFGDVYIDDAGITPDNVTLIFPNESFQAIVYSRGEYIIQIWDDKFVGQTGNFEVIYNAQAYTPLETITIENSVFSYNLDLNIIISSDIESNNPPVANAGVIYYEALGVPILFDGSDSFDSDGIIIQYNWDFGDGVKAIGITASHEYEKPGEYIVNLTVIDNKGEADTDTTYAYITDKANNPPSQPNINGTQNGFVKKSYNYEISAIDADNDDIQYVIDWNDESESTITEYLTNNEIIAVNHFWDLPGSYNISVYAVDISKASSQKNNLIVLIDKAFCEDVGYLIENTNDGVFDLFYSNATGQETSVEHLNGIYYIDYNNDNSWEYTFNSSISKVFNYNQESASDEEHTGLILTLEFYEYLAIAIAIILIIIIAVLAKRRSTKKRLYYVDEIENIEDIEDLEVGEDISELDEEKIKEIEKEIDKLLAEKKK
jgi:PKD repeat protein